MREIKVKLYYRHNETGKIAIKIAKLGEPLPDFDAVVGFGGTWTIIGKGEYTGLKDSNGSEIWEGDIIQTNEAGWVGYVVHDAGQHYLQDDKGGYCRDINAWIEIIGNIHEDKHLLK